MRQARINYVAVGAFVLLSLAGLLVALVAITGSNARTEPYYALYDNVTGVQQGTSVTFGGYQVGKVEQVTPVRKDGRTRFRLRLAIREGWRIPADSVAHIVTPSLLSDSLIDIAEGDSDHMLAPGDTLRGRAETSAMALLNTMARELKSLSDTTLRPLLDNLNQRVDQVGDELTDSLPRMTEGFEGLVERLSAAADRLLDIFSDDNRKRADGLLRSAERASTNLAQLSAEFLQAQAEIDTLLADAREVVEENRGDLRESVVDLRRSMDTVSANIGTIVYNLEAGTRNLNEFSRRIRNDPRVLIRGGNSGHTEDMP